CTIARLPVVGSRITESPLGPVLRVEFVNRQLEQLGIVEVEPRPQHGHLLNRLRAAIRADVLQSGACGGRLRLLLLRPGPAPSGPAGWRRGAAGSDAARRGPWVA